MKYDYLVVGAGLYGAVFAHEAKKTGKSVLVIDKRPNIAGNVYTEAVEGIQVHKYGAHIFHTNNRKVWEYVNQFAEFNRFTNSPVANYNGELYSLPFNMYTFNKMWGVVTPEEAAAKIEEQKKEAGIVEPKNLEEQAISLVGRDIYEKLIKGYTEKQWGRPCNELPAFIIKRLPVRLTFDNNYFNALYQGIPVGGYSKMVENMLQGIDVNLGVDYDRCIRRLLLAVTLCISVATAMVGPISFLGLIIANLSRQMLKTYRHTQLILGSALFGMIGLIFGQLIVERIFVYAIPVSVFITVGGGIYFLYLLLAGKRA